MQWAAEAMRWTRGLFPERHPRAAISALSGSLLGALAFQPRTSRAALFRAWITPLLRGGRSTRGTRGYMKGTS